MKRSVHSSVGDKYTEGSRSRNVNTGIGQQQILVALASFAERKQEQAYQIEMSLCQTATLHPAASGKFSDSIQCVTEQAIAENRGRFCPFTLSFLVSYLK